MKIGEKEVRHVAQLAELAVADSDVALLATQLDAIVEFVAQLDEVAAGPASSVVVGPDHTPLRDDTINPIPMTRTAAQIAPAFQQGFFLVPKLGGMAEE
jgi:aspartyl-tRNA(Asn)/glutamyl-tRNA(Gln) amidotransferase subunit C